MTGFSNVDTSAAGHVPQDLLDRYAAGGPSEELPDVVWAVEAHLESCAPCRERLADAAARLSPQTTALVRRVGAGVFTEIAHSPREEVTRSWWLARVSAGIRRWLTPTLLPRLVMTVLVVLAAVGLDLADGESGGRLPSLVLLLAPVAPLAGVAAAWSRGVDPAFELIVSSPRAGLELVLRRALVVLVVVIPVLSVAGWLVGTSPARWLLPCLAFTLGALALGAVVGLRRAAAGLVLVWTAVVVGPSLVAAETPALLTSAGSPAWAAATAVGAVLLVLRRRGYTGLASVR